jgi:hypothetical protein
VGFNPQSYLTELQSLPSCELIDVGFTTVRFVTTELYSTVLSTVQYLVQYSKVSRILSREIIRRRTECSSEQFRPVPTGNQTDLLL